MSCQSYLKKKKKCLRNKLSPIHFHCHGCVWSFILYLATYHTNHYCATVCLLGTSECSLARCCPAAPYIKIMFPLFVFLDHPQPEVPSGLTLLFVKPSSRVFVHILPLHHLPCNQGEIICSSSSNRCSPLKSGLNLIQLPRSSSYHYFKGES